MKFSRRIITGVAVFYNIRENVMGYGQWIKGLNGYGIVWADGPDCAFDIVAPGALREEGWRFVGQL